MVDLHDDDVMRRFLVDDVSPDERERIEQRFMEDSDYHDELCALEEDLLLSYARGELAEPWRGGLKARLESSEALRRELEALKAFRSGLAAAAPAVRAARKKTAAVIGPAQGWKQRKSPEESPKASKGPAADAAPIVPPRSTLRWAAGIGALAAAALLAVGFWWMARPPVGQPSPAPAVAEKPSGPAAIATFLLVPGLKAERGPSNSFRIPSGAEQIRLQLTLPATSVNAVDATLRPVGAQTLTVASKPVAQRTGDALEISWTVPARQLPPGDYILTIAGGPSRSFSIVE